MGGGVVLYCSSNISSFDHPNKLSNKLFESLWIKIKLKKTKAIHLCVTYRSPSRKQPLSFTKDLCEYLSSCISKIPKGSEIICLGDFNVDWSKRNGLTSIMKDFSRSSNLSQLIDSPTRITDRSSSTIDLIFTNSHCISKSSSIFFGLSDHNLIFCARKYSRPKCNPRVISYRNFKNFDRDKFLEDLSRSDWSIFYNTSDIDNAAKIFNNLVSETASKHAPIT